jgi:excisionase family DNA binding protein
MTVEQFAEHLQVSRTTVFYWLKNGELSEGVHYFRLGHIIRFRYDENLFFTSEPLKKLTADKAKALIRPKGKKLSPAPSRQVVNLDY